jgi:predicted DNA-binding ArsR family transcriptional regulator
MQTILLDQSQITHYKLELAKHLPEVKSSHRTEAIAAGFGFGTYASLVAAMAHAPNKDVAAEFSESMFFDRLKDLKYEGAEKKSLAVQQVFSLYAHIERKNGFGRQAILDLVVAAGYTLMQHDFLDATLLCHVIGENGKINKASVADVAKRMEFGDILMSHVDQISDGLSIKGFSDTDGDFGLKVTAERTIGVCWDLAAASKKKELSSTSSAVVPSFREIKFNAADDTLEFSLHPSALNFLRSRHRLHQEKSTSTGLSPREKDAIANIASISLDAIADLKTLAKGMGMTVDQLAETMPQVKTAVENSNAIFEKASQRLNPDIDAAEESPSLVPKSRPMH